MKALITLAAALLLGACADATLHYTQARPGRVVDPTMAAKAPGLYELIVTRNEAKTGSCPEAAVYLNGKIAAMLAGGETVTLYLPRGSYSVANKGAHPSCSPYIVDMGISLPTARVVSIGFWDYTGDPHISAHEALATGVAASR